MSTTTTKLGLVKPEMTDAADITAMNENWDKIDTNIQNSITHIASTNNPHGVTKAQVGLGNVDNTSDADKPISTAVQTALDEKANTSNLPNITKNTADTTGDIISTHLTIGTRKSNDTMGSCSFTSGANNTASGTNSAVIGSDNNTASGTDSAAIGGNHNTASGAYSAVIGGNHNTALAYQIKTGHYSKDGTAGSSSSSKLGDAFIIGNGTTNSTRSNAFRVAYDGSVYGMSAFNSTGADYAEYFEWLDGNTDSIDRRGMFVTLDGEKIRIANDTDDYILGVVSALPSICGDTQSEVWQGMYLKDVYGAYLTDDDGNMILNPEYDGKNEYISREHRKEWSAVGMLGKLVVRDDGTCQVNEYCEVSKNGVATSSETGYRVLSRIDETHVKILFR